MHWDAILLVQTQNQTEANRGNIKLVCVILIFTTLIDVTCVYRIGIKESSIGWKRKLVIKKSEKLKHCTFFSHSYVYIIEKCNFRLVE